MLLRPISTPDYNNIKISPASPHHHNHTTNKNVSNNANDDLKDQLTVLTEAIRILTRIVTTSNPNPCSSESFDAEKRIEELHLAWKLEETGFSKLFNACKQMQNSLRLTSLEADKAMDDVQRASELAVVRDVEDEARREKIFVLERENLELQMKNQILMGEMKTCKRQKKVIARSVRKFVNVMNEGQTSNSAPTSPIIQGLGLNTISQMQYGTSRSTRLTTTISTSEEDSEEISTTSSSSLVTDDGCATVRLAQRQGRNSKREQVSNIRSKKNLRQRNVLELSFPSKNVGIQFSSVAQKSFGRKKKKGVLSLIHI